MIKATFSILLFFILAACGVNFSSDQVSSIKRLLNKDRHELLDKQWVVLYEGTYHEAYAIIFNEGYRILSLEHLEVHFEGTSITEIRIPTPIKYSIAVNQTNEGFTFIHSQIESALSVNCSELVPVTDVFYTQQCISDDKAWHYQNELQVNQGREIVFIKTHYSPSKPPIELYYGQLLNKLKNKLYD